MDMAQPVNAITRAQIIARAQRWTDASVPYSQSRWVSEDNPSQNASATGNYGTGWRTDCSGYVSFAWNLRRSNGQPDNRVTSTLAQVSQQISNRDDLQPGDILLNPGSHTLIFDHWDNAEHTYYWTYEMHPSRAEYHRIPYPYWSGYGTFTPYRYNNIEAAQDTDGGGMNYSESRQGQINPAGDTDDFTFNGSAGQTVLIQQSKNNSNLDSFVELYRPDGGLLGSDDDSGGSYNSRLQAALPSTGVYRIRAKAYGSSTGAYTLQLTLVSSSSGGGSGGIDSDDGRWIAFGQSLGGTISPNNDTDTYYVSVTSGRTLSIRMNRSSGGLDSYIDLYGPNGALVAFNDDGGGDMNSWLVHQASQNGTYRIVAHSYNGNSGGAYQLSVAAVTAQNMAQGRAATASSVEFNGVEPWRATDGNLGTRWSSQFANDQWWYVDLGSDRQFNQVVINWEAAYGRSYGIYYQSSTMCNSCWTNVFWTNNGDGGVDTINFSTVNARYVLFWGSARGTGYGFSFWELGVYNTNGVMAPTVPPDPEGKLPDSVARVVPLPPADGGKEPQLAGEGVYGQENAPLAASDPGLSPNAELTDTIPLAEIEMAGTSASYDPSSTEPLGLTGNASVSPQSGRTIVAYEWRSDLDGLLSTEISATVPLTQLARGTHTITFRAQDSQGYWSQAQSVVVNLPPQPRRVFLPMVGGN